MKAKACSVPEDNADVFDAQGRVEPFSEAGMQKLVDDKVLSVSAARRLCSASPLMRSFTIKTPRDGGLVFGDSSTPELMKRRMEVYSELYRLQKEYMFPSKTVESITRTISHIRMEMTK